MRSLALFLAALLLAGPAAAQPTSFALTHTSGDPLDGRLILILATSDDAEPRFETRPGVRATQIFGVDVDRWSLDDVAVIDADVFGYPIASFVDVPPGRYYVQAVLNRYKTYHLATGHAVKLPASYAAGQNWRREPGNLYSTALWVDVQPGGRIDLLLDHEMPSVTEPEDTEWVKHVKVRSRLLSDFWGEDVYLGAHVLLPRGFDEHPEARYPLLVFHGHFPSDFGGFRTTPPDPDLECEYSERFHVECYNRIVQLEAYDFYRTWMSDDFPRFLIIEIQHANPYYDDSYAVNSANLGPYGDAITYELIPYIEQQFRGIGEGWARFLYGGSTGGWEALAAQVFYPDDYNGAFAACPDPIDFRQYTLVNLYEDENAYYLDGPFQRLKRPGHRNWLGAVDVTLEDYGHYELVLGERSRSGDQFDIWEAVYSPMDPEGYPQRIWDKKTGVIDRDVAAYWRENYDLRHIMERDWPTLGPKLEGKVHIYVGDMDNYYLNNAVYLTEAFLEKTTDPYYGGEVDYGDRAEHCWNGDHTVGNHLSRLRYNTMYVPKILRRIEASAPPGADVSTWRY